MELDLANAIYNLLLLLFKSLHEDIENFFSDVQFFLQTFSKLFFTKSNYHSNRCDQAQAPLCQVPCNSETNYEDDHERIQIAEMINRVGIECGLEGIKGNTNLCRQDLLSLFEEEEPSLEEIKETFEVFDVNNDGFIDASEVQRVVRNLGFKEGCELEECKRMIKAFDGNGDGLIDFQEFVKFMEKCLC